MPLPFPGGARGEQEGREEAVERKGKGEGESVRRGRWACEEPGTQLVLNQCPFIPFVRREEPSQKGSEETTTEEKREERQPKEGGPGVEIARSTVGALQCWFSSREKEDRKKRSGEGKRQQRERTGEAVLEGDSVGKAVGIQQALNKCLSPFLAASRGGSQEEESKQRGREKGAQGLRGKPGQTDS